MKIAILLSGCGVFDGTEIHEATLSMLAIKELGATYTCIAPNKSQLHVIDHTQGSETKELRNVYTESARIARGEIRELKEMDYDEFDALLIPGGFGVAKNFTNWALHGADCKIDKELKTILINFQSNKKPIVALCMAPVVLAKAFEGKINPTLTVGTPDDSPYDINAIAQGMESIGVTVKMKSITEICVDKENLLVSAPCYMMNADILQVRNNVKQAIAALIELI